MALFLHTAPSGFRVDGSHILRRAELSSRSQEGAHLRLPPEPTNCQFVMQVSTLASFLPVTSLSRRAGFLLKPRCHLKDSLSKDTIDCRQLSD
jgi:hypothetical protein